MQSKNKDLDARYKLYRFLASMGIRKADRPATTAKILKDIEEAMCCLAEIDGNFYSPLFSEDLSDILKST